MELRNVNEDRNIIEKIEEGSIGEEIGLEIGDILLEINSTKVKDIIDYKYLISDDYVLVSILKKNNEIWDYEIEKDFDEDLGIAFTNPLIDRAKRCSNKCIFCFIDQLPDNMRETLYFKDDDSRLSFLQGNFITLTNMSEEEIDRIIDYRISPINVSVHTTNPELRVEMLNNKNAGKVYEILKRFHKAKLDVNCQIVLVPGVNDGQEFKRTIEDLSKLYPTVKSVAAVPVGVTKYREGLYDVIPYDGEMSRQLILETNKYQKKLLDEIGTRFIFLSDEFYALSKIELPSYEAYEGFPQFENGVGLMKLFKREIEEELEKIKKPIEKRDKIIIPTGKLAYDYMKEIAEKIKEKFPGLEIEVVQIDNNFFGETITVAGLLTGQDILDQIASIESEVILISQDMLKSGEDIFLDDISLEEFKSQVNRDVYVVEVDGESMINTIKKEVR